MSKVFHHGDSAAQLREAIRKLADFSELPEDSLSVSKAIRAWLKRNLQHEELLRAIELINSKRLLLEKLRKGSPEEKKLAEALTQAVAAYNASCDKRIQSTWVEKFFNKDPSKFPKIQLHQKHTVKCYYPAPDLEKTHASIEAQDLTLPKQSAELFQMKALALLERYGIASNPEARRAVKQSPIRICVEQNSSMCTLSQKLSLFPGQTIVVKGNSALDPKTRSINELFPETFCLSLESLQTGFPDPSQRTGWALANQHLPQHPQRLDLLPQISALYQRKNQAVAELLPQGSLFKQAKKLLTLKKECFKEHCQELLALHHELAKQIFLASGCPETESVTHFYSALSTHPSPCDWLTETSHLIREHFISKPQHALFEAILSGRETDLSSLDPSHRYSTARNALDQAVAEARIEINAQKEAAKLAHEKIKFDYVEHMGHVIGLASIQIFLQYLSEDLIYSPPSLSSFERQLQAGAYRHLDDFLNGLFLPLGNDEKQNKKNIYHCLKREIESDIFLFRSGGEHPICTELSDYFQERYRSLSAM